MDFYESISAYYDYLFPTDPETLQFLARRAGPGSRVLDLACGTGNYSIALARLGHRVTGIDLDTAMIRVAIQKAGNHSAEFRLMDMLEMRRQLEPGFGLVFCIGNSIVHLADEDKIGVVLRDCHGLMSPGGTLVVQIINYDRVLAKRLMELPTLRNEEQGLVFTRKYDYDNRSKAVQFRSELTVRKDSVVKTIQNCVPLWILRRAVLERLARKAGFQEIELFGGFAGQPYNLESLPLILCGKSGKNR